MLKYKIPTLISLCLVLFFTNKCTLIGYGVGSIIDDNNSGKHYTINEDLFNISPETEIKLITVSNNTIVGFYKNNTNEYSNDYINNYISKYEELKTQISVPNIGDTLFIANPKGEIYKYIFLGFDYKKIYVKSVLSNQERFMSFNPDTKIKLINGEQLNYTFINNGIEFKLIPIMSKMNLKNKIGSQSVFYHNIHNIITDSSNKAKYLTLIGLGIDLFLYFSIERFPGFGDRKLKWRWE